MSYNKHNFSFISVWVKFPKLKVAYWGESCLRKLEGMIGNVIRVDNATFNFDKLMFARVLVDMKIDSVYLDEIYFTNENDNLCTQSVIYVWKPINCQRCNQLGHTKEQCRRVMPTTSAAPVPIPDSIAPESDYKGFQAVRNRVRKVTPAPVQPPSNKEGPDHEQPSYGTEIMRKEAAGPGFTVTVIRTTNGF